MIKIFFFCLICEIINANSFSITTKDYRFYQPRSDTTYRIIKNPNASYGYEILINKKVFVHQKNIPGKQGVKGFNSKTDAKKVAELVLMKVKKGNIPPTITEPELIQLNIK